MKTTLNVVKEIKDLKQCQAVVVAAFSWAVGFAGVLAVWCSRWWREPGLQPAEPGSGWALLPASDLR